MPFCPISGKPVALNNPVKTLVLSVDGQPQHFCCPGHEKRYLRENPGARKVTLHMRLVPSPQFGGATARENKVRVADEEEDGLTVISEATRIGGQRVVLAVFRHEGRDAPDFWNVVLLVGATRQAKKSVRTQAEWPSHYDGKSTGISGLKALMWAKSVLDTFQWRRPEAHLIIGGSDDRRLQMYTRALTRYGFVPGTYQGEDVVFRTNEMYREALRRTPSRDKAQRNPADLRGRHIPERYLAGLPPALRAQRIAELTESRDAYGTGDFSELKTDVKARELGLVKKSKYRVLAEERGFDVSQVGSYEEMIDAVVDYYAGRKPTAAERSRAVEGLKKVYAKGLAAWKSGGHRPGATAKNWADARIASLLVGGKGPRTADKKEFAMLPADVQAAIWQQAPDIASM